MIYVPIFILAISSFQLGFYTSHYYEDKEQYCLSEKAHLKSDKK
jgi:hypothetical protein